MSDGDMTHARDGDGPEDLLRALLRSEECQHEWKYVGRGTTDFRFCPKCRYVEMLGILVDNDTRELRNGQWLPCSWNVDPKKWEEG